MSFRRVLGSGLTALIFVTVLTGATSIIALNRSSTTNEEVTRDFEQDLLAVEELRTQAERVAAASQQGKNVTDAAARFTERLWQLEKRAGKAIALTLDNGGKRYVKVATASPANLDQLLVTFDEFEQYLTEFVRREEANYLEDIAKARRVSDRQELVVLFATALGVLLSIGLAIVVMRRLTTQYRREQAERAKARREAAARQEVLAVVSHDLRNPLNAIMLGSSLLAETVPDIDANRSVRRTIASVRHAANRMTNMIEEILDDARIDAGTIKLAREPRDLAPLVEGVFEIFRHRAAARAIELRREGCEQLLVDVDSERVHQILSNLIGNAMKFTPEGGTISVAISGDAGPATVEVRDTGSGIPPEQLTKLFDRYWRGDRSGERGGLGLGLYICKNLVEAHGGRIWVESKLEQGSSFFFTLPRA